MNRFALRAASLTLPLLLAGCVGKLLGGGTPAQLYRLEGSPPAAAPSAVQATSRVALLLSVRFESAIDTDRVLAVTGSEASYIAGTRWVSTAPVLFDHALRTMFASRAPSLTIVTRRDGASADRALQIVIDHFEARYAAAGAVPTIDVGGEATLLDLKSRAVLGRFPIRATRPAAGNTVATIIEAFEGATADANAGLVDSVEKSVRAVCAPADVCPS